MYNHLNIVSSNFPYIPQQAFLYQPISLNPDIQNQTVQSLQTDDFIVKFKNGTFKRMIFQGNIKYTQFQNNKLQEFQHYLKRKNIQLDERWDRSWRLRWLQSTNFDNKKTVQDMHQFIQYQNKNKEILISQKLLKYLNQGVYYIAGRDSKFRPILILDVKKMIKTKITQEEILQCQIYFFQFIVRNMLIPGHVQQWVTLIDVGYQGVMSMMGPMKSSISFLQSTFRSRMYVSYIIRPSGTCSFLWSIAQKFLQQDTKRKIVFADGQVMSALLQYCNPNQLQQKFGGYLQNFKNDCWPPKIYSDDYSSKQNTRILSIQQYRRKYQRKQLQHTKVYQPFIIPAVKPILQEKAQMKIEQKLFIKKTISKAFTFNAIQVDGQILKSLQKIKQEKLAFLHQLNNQAQDLCPQSGFDWLINEFINE